MENTGRKTIDKKRIVIRYSFLSEKAAILKEVLGQFHTIVSP